MVETLALASAQSSSLAVPLTAGPSSSPVMRKLIEPLNAPLAMKRKAAATEAATPPFMSQAPRPQSPVGDFGRERIEAPARRSPGGTTSVWPAKARFGRAVAEARLEIENVGRPARRK